MKKICFISFQAFPLLADFDFSTHGGAELQFTILANTLVENGFEVHFVVDDFGQSDFESIHGINIHKSSLRYMGGPNKFLLSDWLRFLLCLKKIDADCYLIKTPRHLLFPLAFFKKIFKKKVLFIGQIDEDADKIALKKKEGFFPYWLYVLGMNWVDYIIAQNSFQQRGFILNYKKPTCIIKNALSLPVKKKIKSKKSILWVGNNLPKKHPEIFLDLADHLSEYSFRMIMSTTSQYPSDHHIKKRASGIPNLDYIGFVPFNQIGQYFEEAKLFVGTSDMEGFPNTYLQAWQYKTPVASLYVDPDSVIQRYRLGFYSETFERLCDDVRMIMNNSRLRISMGEKCAHYVTNQHSIKNIMNDYIRIFHKIA